MLNDHIVAAPDEKSEMKSAAKTRHFVDHAATTPLRPEARTAMVENLGLANPSGQYATARIAKKLSLIHI